MLLFGQARVLKSVSLLILGAGYLFGALLSTAHAIADAGGGLLTAGPQTAPWLMLFWQGGFMLFLVAYALLRGARREWLKSDVDFELAFGVSILGSIALASGLTIVATAGEKWLPVLATGGLSVSGGFAFAAVVGPISLLALSLLWRQRGQSLLILWLMVVVVAWLFGFSLEAVFNQGRYDLGWYVGRLFGLVASAFVLVMLLLKSNALHLQAARLRAWERRHNKRRLQASEVRFQATFDQAAVGIAHLTPEGGWMRANGKLCEILGYTWDELKQLSIEDISHPDDFQVCLACMRQLVAGQTSTYSMEKRYRRKEGNIVWTNITASVVKRRGGSPDYLIYVVEDISWRKQAEAELQGLHTEMERLTHFQVASQTAAAIAHDLNQPLNAVAAYSAAALQMLRAGNPQPEKLEHAIESSAQQAQRAGRVVRELLEFMNSGDLQTEAVNLNELVRRLANQIEADRFRSVKFDLDIAPSLPPVRANRLQLEKVLGNLIENGIEACGTGKNDLAGIALRIHALDDRRVAQVTVTDRGHGIESQVLGRVFDPFFSTKPGGLGMGLAICRAIIEAHGGRLWVESTAGGGASFHFTLPFAP